MISSRVQAGLGSALRPGRLAAEMEEDDLGLVGRRPHVPGGAGGSAKVGAVVGAQGMARGAVEIGVLKEKSLIAFLCYFLFLFFKPIYSK